MATYGFLCPTPKSHCCGSNGNYSASLDKQKIKKHGSPEEAMKCYAAYLISEGYERISPREFRKEGEPIMVLTKVSRFGARLRSGKAGEGAAARNSRGMPAMNHGGVIVTT